MDPLKRLVVRNFQAHEKQVVDLDPLVTVFVGPSRRGKSSVLRAFRWVCRNRPSGTAFVRWGSDKCSVALDGVTRVRGKRVNEYRIGDDRYRAVGSDVPPPVNRLLYTSDLNFQRQHDGAFWFTLSPGAAAKALNAVVNLAEIDRAVAIAAAAARKAKTVHDVTRDRLHEARKEYREAKRADGLIVKGRAFLAAHRRYALSCDKTYAAAFCVERATKLLSARDRLSNAILSRSRAIEAGSRAAKAAERHGRLADLLARYDRLVASRPAVGDFSSLQKVRERADKVAIDERDLEALLTLHAKLETDLCQSKARLSASKRKLDKVKVCPTCQRPMTRSASSESRTYTRPLTRRRRGQSRTGTPSCGTSFGL